MDAGCEMHGYTSDITRTWPANGSLLCCAHRCMMAVVIQCPVSGGGEV